MEEEYYTSNLPTLSLPPPLPPNMESPYIPRGNTHAFWHADLTSSYAPRRKRSTNFPRQQGLETKKGVQLEVPKEVRRVDSADLRDGKEIHSQARSLVDSQETRLEPQAGSQVAVIQVPRVEVLQTPGWNASPTQILRYLLSEAGLEASRSEMENQHARALSPCITTYSQLLTPYEELLCAIILSRAIPRDLGLQIIRTVLNAPYHFSTSVAIKIAGPDKVRQALRSACPQHTGKIADEVHILADAISNNNWHNDLAKLRRLGKGSVEAEREVLRRSIKGMGKTGLDLFYRRVQWQWDEIFPYINERTLASLEKLGLPKRPESLLKMIEVRWAELGIEDLDEFSSEEQWKRAFVMLLERAVGADWEKKIQHVREEASMML